MCCGIKHGQKGVYAGHSHMAETYPEDATRYCICPGYKVEFRLDREKNSVNHILRPYDGLEITPENVAIEGKCCGAETGDDHLCDRCREECKAVIEEVKEKGSIEVEETSYLPEPDKV